MTQPHRLLWAKSAKQETPNNWKPVLAHLLDVAASAWELLDLEPASTLDLYTQDLGYPLSQEGRDAARRWTCALIALHDLGKASPAFQQQWLAWPLKTQAAALGLGWPAGANHPSAGPVVSHSLISHATLPSILKRQGWHGRVADAVSDAVGAHHGFRATATELGKAMPKEKGTDAWERVRQDLYEAVCVALDVPAAPTVRQFSGGAYMRLAGLTSFADWVGSSFDLKDFAHEHLDDPREYVDRARALARVKLAEIGWEQRTPLSMTELTFEQVFNLPPRPLQLVTAALTEEATAPTLLLIEAPMGEGKTEAALFAHLTLQRRLGHRGMYVALPTQATGNAMFKRTAQFLSLELFGHMRVVDLQLLHGGKELNRDFGTLQVHPNNRPQQKDAPQEVLQGRGEDVRNVMAREWFTARKRALLSEYGVGTVDQALLGVLPVAHQFIRLWGLGNRTVVLDEVHAYDMYTGHLIEELVKWLGALGSSVILMSATLPLARREALLRAYGAAEVHSPDFYPRMTRVSAGVVNVLPVEADPERRLPFALQSLPEDLRSLAERTLALYAQGGCTAVIVNTVQRAQDLRRLLADLGVPGEDVLLFHARYRNKDRQDRELQVLDKLGKTGARPTRFVLVGTQVLEQSLDYDADVMLTDLAPLDLVLQRAGRLHRHKREAVVRAGHKDPVLHVAGLNADGPPDLKGTSWQYVYQPWPLLRAWALLRGRPGITLPDDLDKLVQVAYQEMDPPGLSDEVTEALRDALQRKQDQDGEGDASATQAAIVSPDRFPHGEDKSPHWDEDTRSDDDPAPRTRLGEKSVTVVPLFRQGGQLLLDPGGRRAPLLRRQFEHGDLPQSSLVALLHERSVRLSRPEVVHVLPVHAHIQVPVKLHWPELPALRDALPLVLDDREGCWAAQVGSTRIEYNFELGVVYAKEG